MEPPSTLVALPRELQDAIASFCDPESLGNLTLVSKGCREIFAYYRFKDVVFEGSPSKFCSRPKYLFENGARNRINVLKYVKSAKFEIGQPRWSRKAHNNPNRLRQLPDRMLQWICQMKNLCDLQLQIPRLSKTQTEMFRDLFSSGPWWKVSHLDIDAHSSIASGAIAACHPGTLKVLKIKPFLICSAYECLAKHQPQLQKLLLDMCWLDRSETGFNERMDVSIASDLALLKRIPRDFKHLRCLMLKGKRLHYLICPSISNESNQFMLLENAIQFLVEDLQHFDKLEQVSFDLFDKVTNGYISESLQRRATDTECDDWYISLGTRIANNAIRLRELVILRNGHGSLMRGLRGSGGGPMVIELTK